MFVAGAGPRRSRGAAAVKWGAESLSSSGPVQSRGIKPNRTLVEGMSRGASGSPPRDRAFAGAARQEGDASAFMSGTADATLDRAAERWTTQLAGALLLVAATAGLLGQGAYYASVQRPVGVLVAVATLLGLTTWPPTSDELRLLTAALTLRAGSSADEKKLTRRSRPSSSRNARMRAPGHPGR
jgi:hypothetical protein